MRMRLMGGLLTGLLLACTGQRALHIAEPPRAHAPPGPTWRARCARLMEQKRAELAPRIPALAQATVRVSREPETIVRLEARVAGGGYYEVILSEPSPNSDFDSDVHEEPWEDIRERMRPAPAPVIALHRLHRDRRAYVAADNVPVALARELGVQMKPVLDECLALAERVISHDHFFAGTVTSITSWSAAANHDAPGDAIQIDDAPHELVTIRVEEADDGAPFRKGKMQGFAVASGAAFRDASAAQRRAYWLRTDTEDGKTTFALARTIGMMDEADKCPDVAEDAGPSNNGCP